MTQKNLASKLNVSETTISKYESNVATPPFDSLRAMSSIFKVSMDELCGNKPTGTVSLHGLSDNQKDIIENLVNTFHSKMNNTKEQYFIIGQIVAEIFK